MQQVPTRCGNCGSTVPVIVWDDGDDMAATARILLVRSSGEVVTIEYTQRDTQSCMPCGTVIAPPAAVVQIVDGTLAALYSFLGDKETTQLLARLTNEWALTPPESPVEAERQLSQISTALRGLLKAAPKDRAEWYAFIAILVAAIQTYLTYVQLHSEHLRLQ